MRKTVGLGPLLSGALLKSALWLLFRGVPRKNAQKRRFWAFNLVFLFVKLCYSFPRPGATNLVSTSPKSPCPLGPLPLVVRPVLLQPVREGSPVVLPLPPPGLLDGAHNGGMRKASIFKGPMVSLLMRICHCLACLGWW